MGSRSVGWLPDALQDVCPPSVSEFHLPGCCRRPSCHRSHLHSGHPLLATLAQRRGAEASSCAPRPSGSRASPRIRAIHTRRAVQKERCAPAKARVQVWAPGREQFRARSGGKTEGGRVKAERSPTRTGPPSKKSNGGDGTVYFRKPGPPARHRARLRRIEPSAANWLDRANPRQRW